MFRWHFKYGNLLTVWGNLEGIPGNPGEIPHIESKFVGSKGLRTFQSFSCFVDHHYMKSVLPGRVLAKGKIKVWVKMSRD